MRGAVLAGLLATTAGLAQAAPVRGTPRPFEVSTTLAGNFLSALVASADSDTLAAATFFREVLRADPRNADLIERTFASNLLDGRMPDAFALADRLIKRDATNGLAHLALAVKAIKGRQFGAARTQLSLGTSAPRQRDITATLLTAWTYAGSGDTKRALDLIDKIDDPRLRVFRDFHGGMIADLGNNAAEAGKRLKSAYEASRNTLRVVDGYARFLARHGDVAEAKRVYQAFSEVLPNHPSITSAVAALNAGSTPDTLIKTAEAGAGEVLYGLGGADGQQGDNVASMIYLRLATFLAPGNDLATITLADLYQQQKQYERAVDIYRSLPATSPLRPSSDIQVGLIYDLMGRTDDARKQLEAAVAARPKDPEALVALGNLDRTHKDFEAASAAYTRALDLGSGGKPDWSTYYFRGVSFERSKKWPQAEADFKKALELFPNQPLVLNYLGYSWVDRGQNLDEAFAMLRKAVDLRPRDGFVIDSLGWAYYKLGNYNDALREMERAIESTPGDPTINDHLGDVYWRVGRQLEAKFQWNHARDLNPDPEDLPKILDKIQNGLDGNGASKAAPGSAATAPAASGG